MENFHIHRFRHGGGKTENVAPVPAEGGGIDLGGVVQFHPAQFPLGGLVLVQEFIDGHEILLIFLQIIKDIAVPPFRGNDHLRLATGAQEFLVEADGVIQHDLVTAHKELGRGHPLQVTEEGRDHGILPVGGITAGVKIQKFCGHGRVRIPVLFVGVAGGGEVRPGGDGDDAAGQRLTEFLQLQAQGIA